MRHAAGVATAVLLATSLAAGHPVTRTEALEAASDLARDVGGYTTRHPGAPGAFAPWSHGRIEAGTPLLVHSYPSLEPSYYYVPLTSSDSGERSFVTLDAVSGSWQAFGRRPDGLLSVARPEAALAASRKLGATVTAESLRTVSMPDHRLYWHVRSRSGSELFIGAHDVTDIRVDAPAAANTLSVAPPAHVPVRSTGAGHEDDRSAARNDAPGSLSRDHPIAFDIPDVPHHYQITNYHCAPAAVQMVMDYWGPQIDQETIGEVANTYSSGTHVSDMMRAGHFSAISTSIQDPGLHGYEERRLGYGAPTCYWSYPDESDPDFPDRHGDLKSIVSAACPVIAVMRYDAAAYGTHARVVKGYDDSTGVYITHDPWFDGVYQGPDVHFNQDFFDELWAAARRWGGFIAPWEVSIDVADEVMCGMPFTVAASVVYRGPHPFGAQDQAHSPTVTLWPSGLFSLVSGESATRPLSGNFSDAGCAYEAVTWELVADTLAQTGLFELTARGIIHESATSYPTYSDSIGGRVEAALSVVRPEFVTVDAAGGGTFTDIQDALDFARNGSTVEVLEGVYTGARNRDLSFHGKDIRLRGVDGPRVTIIDCQDAGRGFCLTSGEGRGAVIEGFTISNGRAPDSGGAAAGGGLYISNASPTLRNVILESNSSPGWAGGLWCSGNAQPRLEGCIFLRNEAACGGAIASGEGAAPELVNCTLAMNAAPEGAGIFCSASSPLLTDTIVYGSLEGAAIGCEQGAAPMVTSCCINGNAGGDELPGSCGAADVLFVDPLLCDAELGALHLQECSPCVGSGAAGGDMGALPARCACEQSEVIRTVPFLHPARPSPFRSATLLQVDIPSHSGGVSLTIYDVSGKLVRTLSAVEVRPDERRYVWRGDDEHGDPVGAGVYFALCEYDSGARTRKVVLIR